MRGRDLRGRDVVRDPTDREARRDEAEPPRPCRRRGRVRRAPPQHEQRARADAERRGEVDGVARRHRRRPQVERELADEDREGPESGDADRRREPAPEVRPPPRRGRDARDRDPRREQQGELPRRERREVELPKTHRRRLPGMDRGRVPVRRVPARRQRQRRHQLGGGAPERLVAERIPEELRRLIGRDVRDVQELTGLERAPEAPGSGERDEREHGAARGARRDDSAPAPSAARGGDAERDAERDRHGGVEDQRRAKERRGPRERAGEDEIAVAPACGEAQEQGRHRDGDEMRIGDRLLVDREPGATERDERGRRHHHRDQHDALPCRHVHEGAGADQRRGHEGEQQGDAIREPRGPDELRDAFERESPERDPEAPHVLAAVAPRPVGHLSVGRRLEREGAVEEGLGLQPVREARGIPASPRAETDGPGEADPEREPGARRQQARAAPPVAAAHRHPR